MTKENQAKRGYALSSHAAIAWREENLDDAGNLIRRPKVAIVPLSLQPYLSPDPPDTRSERVKAMDVDATRAYMASRQGNVWH